MYIAHRPRKQLLLKVRRVPGADGLRHAFATFVASMDRPEIERHGVRDPTC